jgi:hypothetical protein
MLINTRDINGMRLAASDGDIGHVKDFYFDDVNWVVRYLVADTGSWLSGRLVLLSPHAFARFDEAAGVLHMSLTRSQIENSPSIETHRPVSRQYEIDYYRYYGWPAYWNGSAMWGMGGYPVMVPPPITEIGDRLQVHHRDEKHLQSAQAITGYYIQTVDGPIGNVRALMVDDRSWTVPELVIEAGHWYSGKEILLPTSKVMRIAYEESKVFVSLTKEEIKKTHEHELVGAST